MKVSALLACVLIMMPFPAMAAKWVKGGNKSCDQACADPMWSGQYSSSNALLNGQKFYICRANAGGQGFRAGYNLRPNWAGHCWVGYGGAEKPTRPYECLCN